MRTITSRRHRRPLTIALALALGACSHTPFAPHSSGHLLGYPGNEWRSAWFRYYHQLPESSGRELRGYRKLQKHWHFGG